jgi:hypothetical protein
MSRAPLLLAFVALPALAASLGVLDDAQRREAVQKASREELAQAMEQTPPRTLIEIGKKAAAALGEYSYRLAKTERVKGKLLDEQTMDVYVREEPFAVRLEYVKGPAAGRKVAYDSKSRANEFRVHEAGFFSLLGNMWLSCDSSLAKSDSNHTVKEAGMMRLLTRLERDFVRGETEGGFQVKPEGWNADGQWCAVYLAPNQGKDFAAYKTRICTDLMAGLPLRVETYDLQDRLLERYVVWDVKRLDKPDAFFDPGKL